LCFVASLTIHFIKSFNVDYFDHQQYNSCSWILDGGIVLSEKDVMRFLQVLGLSKREIQVYMFLAKSGVQSTSFVAKRLKMERVQAYRTFKKLQEKGFIEATLERPTRFTIVGFSVFADN
jgi:hypothetical protein